MTAYDERIERLRDARASVSVATLELVHDQGKKAAANMLLMYGDKSCLSATGFIYCVQSAHEAALLHLLAEGIVVLADDATASVEERAERAAAAEQPDDQRPALHSVPDVGAYL